MQSYAKNAERCVVYGREVELGAMQIRGKNWKPYISPERATVRQIAHELLKVLVPNYSQRPKFNGSGIVIGNATVISEPLGERTVYIISSLVVL